MKTAQNKKIDSPLDQYIKKENIPVITSVSLRGDQAAWLNSKKIKNISQLFRDLLDNFIESTKVK
jgi:hypothetical protein